MEYFLERIAKKIFTDYKDRLNTQCLVFPSRRAGLFFMKYLAAELNKPVWAPSVMTINDLFHSLSTLRIAETEVLLFELYKVYHSLKKSRETFDDFYFWGDMLLNDFDDIDKYLVDASRLFRNVYDLKLIDNQFETLTQEQKDIIRQFWTNFNPDNPTVEKAKFISIWSILNDLYYGFKEVLKKKNYAYEGMIFRNVIEESEWTKPSSFRWEMVHFIGFNALNECEKSLMTGLKQLDKAMFYWDFDNSYIKSGEINSAGYFLRKNIYNLGNNMPSDWNYDTLLSVSSGKIRRKVIETSSDIAQVKLISGLIKGMPDLTPGNAHQTAVVLADENLLVPVLSSLPDNLDNVNVTMGYPMRETSVFSLIMYLFDLQRNAKVKNGTVYFATKDVFRILGNNLISKSIKGEESKLIKEIIEHNLVNITSGYFDKIEILKVIFTKPSTPTLLSQYLRTILFLIVQSDNKEESDTADGIVPRSIQNEFIYRAILSINRMEMISEDPEIKFTPDTWAKMFERILRVQTVPFSGEPLSGIQIMGLLETRTLDFRNLIILSVNEGVMPSITTSSSFIPFSLREAFGLPSINHQESIYAYHFYRLLHRAENATFLFNSNSEGLRSGEMSRFLLQMRYEPLLEPEHLNLNLEIKNPVSPSNSIERTEEIDLKLLSRFSANGKQKIISPSALNTWLNCRMKFYYRYVNDLREPEKIKEEIDPAMLGSLLHEAMKKLYSGFIGETIEPGVFEAIRRNRENLSKLINNTIKELFLSSNDHYLMINEFIARNVLMTYISRILEIDEKAAPIKIMALERPVQFSLKEISGRKIYEKLMGGVIDRIDIKNGLTRIVDYKTGSVADSMKSVRELFKDDRKQDLDCWMQTMLYCEGYISENPKTLVAPSVYKVRRLPDDKVTDKLMLKASKNEEIVVEDFTAVREEFIEGLINTVNTIFNINEPFIMTRDIANKCPNCIYRKLCKR